MDMISLFSDDLILKILSFAPTKVAITTSLLSTRWRYLWKYVPKLEYCDPCQTTAHWKAQLFVDKFLLLQRAPVLETLQLSLGQNCRPTDIESWISIAIARGVRDLHLSQYKPVSGTVTLPMSLYTCEALVVLKLHGDIIADVPSNINFKSLKMLSLRVVKFSSDEVVDRLLSSCPILEDLSVLRRSDDNVKIITIAGPLLQKLVISDPRYGSPDQGDDRGFLINAPSLEHLKIVQRFSWFHLSDNMPKLVKANIKLRHGESVQLLGYLSSAKHLCLCIKPQMVKILCFIL